MRTFFTIEEAAALLYVQTADIRHWIRTGSIKADAIGDGYEIAREELEGMAHGYKKRALEKAQGVRRLQEKRFAEWNRRAEQLTLDL